MSAPYSQDLRQRIVDDHDKSRSCLKTGKRYNVSPSTVGNYKRLLSETGDLLPCTQGRPVGSGKLAGQETLLCDFFKENHKAQSWR